ncbi:MAG: hypothetical protein ACOC5U_02870, partial [Candidatus Aminicenantaceae bacterium]
MPVFLLLGLAALLLGAQTVKRLGLMPGKSYNLAVSADRHWIDTGFDVKRDQVLHFRASGMISLQRGNPMAYCGPDGYKDLKT